MAILVTGASSRFGQVVVRRLLREKRAVRVLSRRPFLIRRLLGESVEMHEWHPISESVPESAVEGVTAIVHLVGRSPLSVAGDAAAAEVRRAATRRLVEALPTSDVRLVMTSMLPDLGGASADAVLTDEAVGAGGADDVIEAAALAAGERGASVAVVRLGLLAQPGAPLEALVALARWGMVPNLAGRRVPAIDAEDAAAMLSGLLDRTELTGHFLGVSPVAVEGEALAEALARAAPMRLPHSMRLPPAALRALFASRLGSMADLLLARQQLVPQRLLDAGAAFARPDPTELLVAAIAELAQARNMPLAWLRLPDVAAARAMLRRPTPASGRMGEAEAGEDAGQRGASEAVKPRPLPSREQP